ncbi:TetR/AcrR family transcriptional regulator [Nocardioides donggukensis]|uniref:TetR/AcrR family transcriptional regulator n=1 Tax=Nocardioides donggukensis TaxID=2774019 RepID=A0A927K5H4_9ACTN|nr:TetR/AcrR family transcriptional regulator [Nocardioides donggukensis]MBD8871107.1 TetR/AcrR family transcriptional regulator [Nocardioides donggukensis]
MSSLRHKQSPRDGYLDAARECILDVGWRRTTLTEVARRAGVSRMTIYRTWSDMPQLLGDLMTREWHGVVAAALPPDPSPDGSAVAGGAGVTGTSGATGTSEPGGPAAALAEAVVGTVQALRANELFVRIVELDPELILPYLLSRRGRSQEAILALAEPLIRAGQAEGGIRAGDPAALARSVLLAAHGFVISAHTMVDDDVSLADLDAELGRLLTRALAP